MTMNSARIYANAVIGHVLNTVKCNQVDTYKKKFMSVSPYNTDPHLRCQIGRNIYTIKDETHAIQDACSAAWYDITHGVMPFKELLKTSANELNERIEELRKFTAKVEQAGIKKYGFESIDGFYNSQNTPGKLLKLLGAEIEIREYRDLFLATLMKMEHLEPPTTIDMLYQPDWWKESRYANVLNLQSASSFGTTAEFRRDLDRAIADLI